MSDNRTGRGYSTAFEDHQGLLHNFTKQSFGILGEFKIPIDYEDVFQEACIAYTKARDGYKPELGFTFSAYMGRAVTTHLTRFRSKLIREAQNVGTSSVNEWWAEDGGENSGVSDIYSYIESEEMTPEERLVAEDEAHHLYESLSPDALAVVNRIIVKATSKLRGGEALSARDIFAESLLTIESRYKSRKIYEELYAVYGVDKRKLAKPKMKECAA